MPDRESSNDRTGPSPWPRTQACTEAELEDSLLRVPQLLLTRKVCQLVPQDSQCQTSCHPQEVFRKKRYNPNQPNPKIRSYPDVHLAHAGLEPSSASRSLRGLLR